MELEEPRKSPELGSMRTVLIASLLLLAACRQEQGDNEPAESPVGAGPKAKAETAGFDVYQASGRDRLCVGGGRAGFIVFANQGDSNCSVSGSVERSGDQLTIRPDGDNSCSITVVEDGTTLRLGPLAPACAYYCGPNASFAGVTFNAMQGPQPVTDLAGDPLC